MRPASTILIMIFALATDSAVAMQTNERADPLAAIGWLVGDWTGVGEGQPGTSASSRHAERAHDGHFIRIDGRSVYPRQERNRTGEIHTSLDIWSYDRRRGLIVMRQFDSLGFASTYVQDRAASTNARLVLVSESLENVPAGWRARYTYEHPAADEYLELFELDSGHGFERYVAGRFLSSQQTTAGPSGGRPASFSIPRR
jgi:hypothetical protein